MADKRTGRRPSATETAFEAWAKSQSHVDANVLNQYRAIIEKNSGAINHLSDFLTLEDLKSGKSYDKSSHEHNNNNNNEDGSNSNSGSNGSLNNLNTNSSKDNNKGKFNTFTRTLSMRKLQFRRSIIGTVSSKSQLPASIETDYDIQSLGEHQLDHHSDTNSSREGRSNTIGPLTPPNSIIDNESNRGSTNNINSISGSSTSINSISTSTSTTTSPPTSPSLSSRKSNTLPKANTELQQQQQQQSTLGDNKPVHNSSLEEIKNVRQLSVDGMEYYIQKNDGRIIITGGLLEKLVAKLADKESLDTEYFNIFLFTFRHVVSPKELLEMLIERFNYEDQESKLEGAYGVVQLRTCNFVMKWMEKSWYDFHGIDSMLILTDQLMKNMLERKCDALAQKMRLTMERKFQETEKEIDEAIARVNTVQKSSLEFDSIGVQELFEQLTLIDLKLFRAIKPEEFIIQLWGNDEDPNTWLAKYNLTTYVEWFNKVSTWVSTEICLSSENKQRALIIEKFIKVAKLCKKYHNFSTLYAILSGLNHGAVFRMKKSWEIVSHRSVSTLRELEQVMDPTHNFDNYRKFLKTKNNLPLLPILGLFLKDLTFLNEIPKKIHDNFISFFKLRAVHEAITDFLKFQNSEFPNFKVDPKTEAFCQSVKAASDRVLYQYSYLCEPRSNSLQEKLKLIENLETSNFGRSSTSGSLLPPTERRASVQLTSRDRSSSAASLVSSVSNIDDTHSNIHNSSFNNIHNTGSGGSGSGSGSGHNSGNNSNSHSHQSLAVPTSVSTTPTATTVSQHSILRNQDSNASIVSSYSVSSAPTISKYSLEIGSSNGNGSPTVSTNALNGHGGNELLDDSDSVSPLPSTGSSNNHHHYQPSPLSNMNNNSNNNSQNNNDNAESDEDDETIDGTSKSNRRPSYSASVLSREFRIEPPMLDLENVETML